MTVFLAEMGSKLERTIVMILAVSGGFLLGYLLMGVFLYFFIHYITRSKSGTPRLVSNILRVSAGVLTALFVYFYVFGEGGSGIGGSGGGNIGNPGEAQTKKEETTPTAITPKKEEPKKVIESNAGEMLLIWVLEAPRYDGKFFRFDGEDEPLTIKAVSDRLESLSKRAEKPIRVVKIKLLNEKASPQYGNALRLQLKERYTGLTVDLES